MIRGLLAILLATALSPAAGAAPPPGAVPFDLEAVPLGGRSQRVVEAWEREGVIYVSVDDLSLVLGVSFHSWSDLGKVTLDLPGAPVWVLEGSEFARIGEDRQ